MYKKFQLLFFIILLLTGCGQYNLNNSLIIEIINIEEKINISSIYEDVYGIVIFEEYGRPNKENTNTVIGAHSGIGDNAYFNDLIKLQKGDIIQIIYENINYEYLIENVYSTDKSNISILNDKNYTSLTLITCDLTDKNKRIIVEARKS